MTSQDPPAALARRIEEASLNAWPALETLLLDGWLLRFAGGFTKRANCVVPTYPALENATGKIRYCENLYARERLKTIFRLTTLADPAALDRELAGRGYTLVEPTCVLAARVQAPSRPLAGNHAPARLSWLAPSDWLGVYGDLTGMPAETQRLHAALLKGIKTETAFAALHQDGEAVACGLAVLENDLLGLFDIVTHPGYRRRGHGARLVADLIAFGAERGARHAYLQVVEGNAAGHALYRKLGFAEAYRYWYRIAP